MSLPRSTTARTYYRAGLQRLDDAQLLLEAGRTTGAVYLAGYSVECLLKALLLDSVPRGRSVQLLGEFRGRRGHDIEWLGGLYRRHVGVAVPRDITRHLSRITSWTTDIRYNAGTLRRSDADAFVASVIAVDQRADGRM